MKNDSSRSHPTAEVPEGAELCLSCGLCCSGEFGPHARIGPDEIDHARALGLAVEAFQDRYHFGLPCPLYRDNGCSIYTARRPRICGDYQCELLKKFLSGAITREHGTQIVRRTRELLTAVLNQMPEGGSWNELQREMERDWDSGQGHFGSPRMRQVHAEFFLAVASLKMYVGKHFGESQSRSPS
jgi:Fe-S-cluster containining protein